MEGARALVAMEPAKIGKPNRQIAIRALLRAIHDVMPGAVHRLYAVTDAPSFGTGVDDVTPIAFRIGRQEHVLAKEFPVPRGVEQLVAENLRRNHLGES